MNKKDIQIRFMQELETVILEVEQLSEDDEDTLSDLKIEHFMSVVGNLFLNYFQNNLADAVMVGKEYQDILASAQHFIENSYLAELEGLLDEVMFEGDMWITMCEMRSNIEAFNVMFGPLVGELDIDQIDKTLREKSRFGGIDELEGVPAHTPKSHWWWFC